MKEALIDAQIIKEFSKQSPGEVKVWVFSGEKRIIKIVNPLLIDFLFSFSEGFKKFKKFNREVFMQSALTTHYLIRLNAEREEIFLPPVSREALIKYQQLTSRLLPHNPDDRENKITWLSNLSQVLEKVSPGLCDVLFPNAIPEEAVWGIAGVAIPYFYTLNPDAKL